MLLYLKLHEFGMLFVQVEYSLVLGMYLYRS